MANRTFTGYSPTEDQTIDFVDHEGNPQIFRLNPALPGKIILDFMSVSGSEDTSGISDSLKAVLDAAIVAEDKERWEAFILEPLNGITISVLSEVVGHVTAVLSGNSQGRE